MNHNLTSAATLAPDRRKLSTLASIWSDRRAGKDRPLTNLQYARFRIEHPEESSTMHERGRLSRWLLVFAVLGGIADYFVIEALFTLAHNPHVIAIFRAALTGGR